MAQKVDVRFVDDLDGSEAAGTVTFALDGKAYEIDLSDENAARLRDSLATFVAAARRTGRGLLPRASLKSKFHYHFFSHPLHSWLLSRTLTNNNNNNTNGSGGGNRCCLVFPRLAGAESEASAAGPGRTDRPVFTTISYSV